MKMLILTLVSLTLMGCKFFGTNTGNPDAVNSRSSGALILGNVVCTKIKSCYSSSDEYDCFDQITSLNNYTVELGTTAAAFETLTDLGNAELNGEISLDLTNYENCIQALRSLDCSDNLVQTAYSEGLPSDYSTTNILFRASGTCVQIY
jgi:hypothetical protein